MTTLYLGYWYADRQYWNMALVWIRLSYGFSIVAMSLMTVFIYFFPKTVLTIRRLFGVLYIGITAITFCIASFTTSIHHSFIIENGVYVNDNLGSLYFLYLFDIIFNLFAPFIILIIKLKDIQGIERRKMMMVMYGYLLFVAIAVTTNVVLPVFNIIILQRQIPIVILFFVLPTYYAIQRFRFFNLAYIYRKLAREGLLLAGYVLFALFISKGLISFFPVLAKDISLVISILVAGGLYMYARSIIPEFYDIGMRGLKNAITNLKSKIYYCDTFGKLLEILQETFTVKLDFARADLYVIRKRNGETSEKTDKKTISIFYENDFSRTLKDFRNDVVVSQEIDYKHIPQAEKNKLKKGLKELNADLCLPLFSENKLFGFLALAKKEGVTLLTGETINEIANTRHDLEIGTMNILLKMNLQEENDLMKAAIARKTKQLRVQYEAIQELVRQQSDFLAVTAHELRTPLSIALFRVEDMLSGKQKPKNLKENLESVDAALTTLKELTARLFSVQQYDLKKVKPNPEKTDIKEFIQSVFRDFTGIMKEKSVEFLLEDRLKKKIFCKIDKAQMNQVLRNLIGNAIKFVPANKGKITLGVKTKNHHVLITVRDNGPGVPDKMKKKVFDKFRTKGPGGGIGLGLYICQKIAELHKGKIWMEDAPEGGALFALYLPRLMK
ncbi:hypothetical protein JXA05_04075 [Candidatus Peregrinibacteria bacterium]|nr:hypothetical protein [Candidatus Peregrinibacteria bacterium]